MWIVECMYSDGKWYKSIAAGCCGLFNSFESAQDAIVATGGTPERYRARQLPVPDRPPVPHYARLSPEPIEVIDAWGWDKDYYRSQILRYLSRAGHKDSEAELKDLKKAQDYLGRLIAKTEGRNGVWK